MEKKIIEEKLCEIVAEILGTPKEELKRNTTFVQDLGADSLTIMEIMTRCEDAFQITISDEEAENMKSIGDAVDYIASRVKK